MASSVSANPNKQISEFHQLVRNFGTTAQRPTTDLVIYQTYFNQDIPDWQWWDGSTWHNLGAGGGGYITAVTLPLHVTGANLSLAIDTSDDGGAIAKQASYPGNYQVGNIHVNGTIGADTRINLNTVPMLERGNTFPTTGLVDGQRYWNTTYRSWFTYVLADTKWRQESPGVFDGAFPTVATGDNTVAPKIEVKRRDLNNRNYFWDGAAWNPVAGTVIPFSRNFRIRDDTTSRANGYVNNSIQVTGVTDVLGSLGTFPAKCSGIWINLIVLTAAAGVGVSLIIESATGGAGAVMMQGTTVLAGGINAYSASGFVALDSLGQIRLQQGSTANITRTIIDVTAYVL